jgi:hypothetical protein
MQRKMRRLHRSVGVIVVFFLFLFAFTGILINHSEDLSLKERHVSWPWLMQHYGIGDVQPDVSFLIDNHVFSQFETQLFIDSSPVTHLDRRLLGGIVLEDLLILATDDSLILMTRDGDFIEKLGAETGVPMGIQNIGVYRGEPVLQAETGMWRSDFLLDDWQLVVLDGVSWSHPFPMPASVKDDLSRFFYGQGVSVQQLLVDIHNGRILGIFGVLVMDFMAILLIFMAISGLWVWSRK